MSIAQPVYIGTDGGATTSKIAGVWGSGVPVSTGLLQWPTSAQEGPQAVVRGWVAAISAYLEQNQLSWDQVQGVGVAIPGPRRSYGVLERGPNLPESFVGFDVYTSYGGALAERAGRAVPLVVGNDGNLGGVAEA
ncbi:MAG: ROK family protein, partial [Chloroflexales bacterium]|nr:ROK family protein [Chloroflexales bacterium]